MLPIDGDIEITVINVEDVMERFEGVDTIPLRALYLKIDLGSGSRTFFAYESPK